VTAHIGELYGIVDVGGYLFKSYIFHSGKFTWLHQIQL